MKKALTLALAATLTLGAVASLSSCGEKDGDLVKLIDVKLTDEEYAFVVDKDNTTLKDDFNTFLAGLKADGTFDDIMDKYFKGEGTKTGYPLATGDVKNTDDNFVVVTNCPFEPFEYIGDDGKIYGLDIEIAGLYAKEKNLDFVVKNIKFDNIFTEIDAGYADIGMAGITVSEDRALLYGFTETYYNASQQLIVSADNSDFDDCKTTADVEAVLSNLSGKKIGYQIGTTGGMYIVGDEDWGYDGFSNIEGKGYQSAQDAATDLINGNLYAVIVDNAPANAIVKAVNK